MADSKNKLGNMFITQTLPDPSLNGYWDDIVIDPITKKGLSNYCGFVSKLRPLSKTRCAIYQSVLLYGEPGSGKSSLALGVANRIAEAVCAKTGEHTTLLRINLSAIFNELLGETQKRIAKCFQTIRMASRHGHVFVILDEVESLAVDRKSLGAGDPSEMTRAVNELLCQLDRLRMSNGRYLILMTSNFRDAADKAILDRVDVDFYIGRPTRENARTILEGSGKELEKLKIKVSQGYIDCIVDKLYNGEDSGELSGRDLARLFPLGMALTGRCDISVNDVIGTARMLMSRKK